MGLKAESWVAGEGEAGRTLGAEGGLQGAQLYIGRHCLWLQMHERASPTAEGWR